MPSLPAIDLKTGVVLSPHVVILGAGASAGTCPNGDRNGIKLPVMKDFISVVGLKDLLVKAGYGSNSESNLEDIYDSLSRSGEHAEVLNELELRVYDYFATLALPEEPTPYDYLLMGLRKKDLVATFNWDPLLVQAFRRNLSMGELPQIVFLHGNVAIGTCLEDSVKGFMGDTCGKCGKPLGPTKLLYPIGQKNYDADPFIRGEWEILRAAISQAYMMQIFGYSAPKTDVEAKSIMHGAWNTNQTHELAEIEIVDLKSSEEVRETWADFIVRQHYGVSDQIQRTWLFRHPRRTCEAFAAATLQNAPLPRNSDLTFTSSHDLQEWVSPLIVEEIEYEKSGTPFAARVPLGH